MRQTLDALGYLASSKLSGRDNRRVWQGDKLRDKSVEKIGAKRAKRVRRTARPLKGLEENAELAEI